MADVKISTLLVRSEMDSSKYAAGAQQKVTADQAMIKSGNDVKVSVTDTQVKISQAGDVLNRLSRQYVDGFAAAQKFNAALNQLSNGVERGRITMAQAEPILEGIFAKYNMMGNAAQFAARGQDQLAAAITRANAKLADQRRIGPSNQNTLGAFGAFNSGQQIQDIAVTAAMGQSIPTIALQQGLQLGTALEIQLQNARAAGVSMGTALLSTFTGLLNPINLIAIGLTAVTAAAIQYFMTDDEAKSLTDALSDQRDAVNELAAAYGAAALKADDFGKRSRISAESLLRRQTGAAAAALAAEVGDALDKLTELSGGGGEAFVGIREKFQPFARELEDFRARVLSGEGWGAFVQLEKDLDAVVQQQPGLQDVRDEIMGIADAGAQAAQQLANAASALDTITNPDKQGRLVRRVSPQELNVMARMGIFGEPSEGEPADVPTPTARPNVELEGLPGELEQKAAVDALLQSQTNQLEVMREEIRLQNEAIGVRNASIAAIKAEQEIRRLGIDATSEEADAIRQNAAEIAALTERQRVAADAFKEMQKAGQEAAERLKESWGEVFDTIDNGIDGVVDALFEGGDIEEALKKMGRDFARTIFDQSITNPLKNWLTGANLNTIGDLGIFGSGASTGRGGGFGGAIGSLFGLDSKLSAMNVQAAVVNINGGVGGGSGILGALGLGGGAANDNLTTGGSVQDYIQKRISDAFGDTLSGGGGTDTLLGGDIGRYASAIKAVESSGNYGALGSILKSGDRAYGAYQVMGNNVGPWTERWFGQRLTPNQFLRNPAAQDAVFNGEFGSYVDKWGPSRAANAWFTGSPDKVARDINISSTEYVSRFNNALEGSAGRLTNLTEAGSQLTNNFAQLGNGLQNLGGMLSSFMSSSMGGGSSWFQGLMGSFGGIGGAFGFMNSVSPAATASIIGAGGGFTGLYHEGGIAGSPSSMRFVHPSIFMGAQRYHSGGLAGDEVPAILRRGEPVFRNMDHARQVVGANQNVGAIAAQVAKLIQLKPNFIMLDDPQRLGDYVRGDNGNKAIFTEIRRNRMGRDL